ncbi:thioredoxin-like protein [Parasitella parasitica]|nr:thioredoxin-like protein [Parasitella parasitica]
MKSYIWLAAAFLANAVASGSATHVVTLGNMQEFDNAINSNELVLLKFFAPWCPHCQALKPEYENAALDLQSDKIVLAEVDCTVSHDICARYQVQGYPTMQVFRKGHPSDIYNSERDSNSIAKYMRNHAMTDYSNIQTKKELDNLREKEALLVVAYMSPEDQASLSAWKTLSGQLVDDFAFGVVTDQSLMQAEGIDSWPSVVLYKHFDGLRDVYTGSIVPEQVEDFIKVNAVPLLAPVESSTFMDYVDAGRPLAYIFSDSDEMKNQMHQLFWPLTKKYRGLFSFAHIDANQYRSQADFLSLNNTWPALAVHNFKSGARFPFDQSKQVNEHEVDLFLNAILQGQAEPALKSQSFLVRKPEDAVKAVAGKDFEEIVMDKARDVLLEIYAPWCGHCQALAPVYQQLGEVMQANNAEKDHGIVIAKMDGTVNDVPLSAGFSVKGYPTIKLFKANTNTIVDYTGQRTLHDFVKFLNEHSTKQTLKLDLALLPQPGEKVLEQVANSEKHDEL